ncbi:MAG: DUF58 domain-containing protein, partial [Spirochaetota bacterium]|nr:DUF58 domain-containing protein [Spirochaetota bacterium]
IILMVESSLISLVALDVLKGDFTAYTLLRVVLLVIALGYLLLPRVRKGFANGYSGDIPLKKGSQAVTINERFSEQLLRLRNASPLTVRGHFVLILSLVFGYQLGLLKKDFFVIILSIGGIVCLGTLLTANFIQYSLAVYLLKRKPEAITFRLPFQEGNTGKAIPYFLSTDGWRIIPLFKIALDIVPDHDNPFVAEDSRNWILVDIYSRKSFSKDATMVYQLRGHYQYNHARLSSLDGAGLTGITWNHPVHEEIHIYPNIKSRDYKFYHISSTREDFIDSAHRYVDGDYYEHRKYETGDDMRRINWKLTAKRGELHTRIPERVQPTFQDVPIFLSCYNPFPHEIYTEEMSELLEDTVEELASYCYFLLKQNYKVILGSDGMWEDFTIHTEFKDMMRFLSKVQWQREDCFDAMISRYLQRLAEDFIRVNNLVLFMPLLSESRLSEISRLMTRHFFSATVVSQKITDYITVSEPAFSDVDKESWMSKLVFTDQSPEQSGGSGTTNTLNRVFYRKRLSGSTRMRLISMNDQLNYQSNIEDMRGDYLLSLHFLESKNDKTLM